MSDRPRKRPSPPAEAFEAAAQEDASAPFERVVNFASDITHKPEEGNGKPKVRDMVARMLAMDAWMADQAGGIYRYNGTHWDKTDMRGLKAQCFAVDDVEATTQKRRGEVAEQVVLSVMRDEIPWRRLADNEVPCLNGVVNIDTCDVRPHRKDDFLEKVIPHAYDPQAKHPTWTRVLADYFGDEQEKIDAIQEFFGYILMPHARYKKALMLQGPSDTGKSVIVQAITDLVGRGNHCSIPVDKMDSAEEMAGIVGMYVNLMSELPTDRAIADSGFKRLVSSGDPVQVNEKWEKRHSYQPFCKHVFACNSLPVMNDRTRAVTNRLMLIRMTKVFTGREDRHLQSSLREEMQGILAWAVEGAARLLANRGEFTVIPGAEQMIERYRFQSNPVLMFLAETAVQHEDARMPMPQFRQKLYEWGHRAYTERAIDNMLEGAGLEVVADSINGKPTRCLLGWYFP